jgi:2,3-bisphosphoglycerate-dependent phosphoglycerate mutase
MSSRTVTAKVYLVRHGETPENQKRIIQGQLDTDLNELGLEQARLVALALKDVPIDIAYTSGLKRAAKVMSVLSMNIVALTSNFDLADRRGYT